MNSLAQMAPYPQATHSARTRRAAQTDDAMIHAYDRLAPIYDHLHARWLRFAGGEAQAALEAALRVAMTPDMTLLDAGCGTGRMARRLLSDGIEASQITLLDPSEAMLAQCADMSVRRSLGCLEALPFEASRFDIVTCAWVLETVPQPCDALRELCRVLRPGGALCLTFCAQRPARDVIDWVMCRGLCLRRTGRFLSIDAVKAGLEQAMVCDVRVLPCYGPAATLIARRCA
ncbi:MAG: methyltransferase domain-containing protein [Pseudomonadota bacterium]